ncbi:hypothetical protein [uncultured Tenacibaculum sp.]|uniref:hypothetical protein n=1 Tax=uncultured Tenacibaculum sp. TaxID=174713 RepID=UPI00262BD192|nr:hypothetical protein [uncultured Tenacibaculum sp.]
MKLVKHIKILGLAFVMLGAVSCDQDVDLPNIPRDNSTLAIIEEDVITLNEGDPLSFTIVQENLIEVKFDGKEFFDDVSGQLGIRVIGGTAVEGEDYTFNIPTIQDVSPFLVQDGYYYGYDASISLEHVVNNIITIINDGVTEGVETIELQFFPVGIGGVIFNDTLEIEIMD